MNLRQTTSAVILVVAICIAAAAQEPPKAELLDEHGLITCEHLLALTDSLAATLSNEPVATAAIIIYRPTVQPTQAERRRRLISSTLQLRGLDLTRFSFFLIDKSPDGVIRSEFWIVPPGATMPRTDAKLWNEPPPDTSRPFLFGYENETAICPTYVPRAFAGLLKDNPGSTGRVIVTVGTDALVERFSFAENFINDLVQNHGVPRKRLRLIFRKSKDKTGAEFWFIPRQ